MRRLLLAMCLVPCAINFLLQSQEQPTKAAVGQPATFDICQKTRALDQAAPLVGWELSECFARLRRLLEARLSKGGKREYVQVLRLL
ncbi:MAG TPA: hypothetical protein VKG65_02840, partial [Terriglobales bacterium]|nr:hypothetical protein [Terriglobales bacterium]